MSCGEKYRRSHKTLAPHTFSRGNLPNSNTTGDPSFYFSFGCSALHVIDDLSGLKDRILQRRAVSLSGDELCACTRAASPRYYTTILSFSEGSGR